MHNDNEIIKKLQEHLALKDGGKKEHITSLSALNDLLEVTENANKKLRAEIERLKENNQKLYEEMAERQKEEVAIAKRMGKSEAIKEFAERLKEKADRGFWQEHSYVDVDEIDNLVREMVGDDK